MPELTFITGVAVAVYVGGRLVVGPRVHTRPLALVLLAAGGTLGAALAAPALLPFAEYVPRSFNYHSAALGSHTPATLSPGELLNWLMPKISPTKTVSYAGTTNWVGLGAAMLALAGVTSRRSMRRYLGWPIVAFGAVVALQVYGGVLVDWVRFLPLWSVANWSEFATPIVAFAIALLAGIGVQTLLDGSLHRRAFRLRTRWPCPHARSLRARDGPIARVRPSRVVPRRVAARPRGCGASRRHNCLPHTASSCVHRCRDRRRGACPTHPARHPVPALHAVPEAELDLCTRRRDVGRQITRLQLRRLSLPRDATVYGLQDPLDADRESGDTSRTHTSLHVVRR